jgi:hypothetical protein
MFPFFLREIEGRTPDACFGVVEDSRPGCIDLQISS